MESITHDKSIRAEVLGDRDWVFMGKFGVGTQKTADPGIWSKIKSCWRKLVGEAEYVEGKELS